MDRRTYRPIGMSAEHTILPGVPGVPGAARPPFGPEQVRTSGTMDRWLTC